MQIHIFRGPGRILGFTAHSSDENLQKKYAPWTAFKTIDLRRDDRTPGVDANQCLDDIEANGEHLTEAHVRITEEAIR